MKVKGNLVTQSPKVLAFVKVLGLPNSNRRGRQRRQIAATGTLERMTGSDLDFEQLFDQITKLELLPGTKISEADVAKTFGYSRQPVREAFTRLAGLNLLLVRPQRATVVRPFSRELIANARFVRTAIELEVVRAASAERDTSDDAILNSNMKDQAEAISVEDTDRFHELDYEFHRLLCRSARQTLAFKLIAANKAQVDRLCMLALTSKDAMEVLYADHERLLEAIMSSDTAAADQTLRLHLSRLTPTIEAIYTTHRAYFDDQHFVGSGG